MDIDLSRTSEKEKNFKPGTKPLYIPIMRDNEEKIFGEP